jgi:hypothetical protein
MDAPNIPDGQLDLSSTSLTLFGAGANAVSFLADVNQNFVSLLSSFSGPNAPANPVAGQLWFQSPANALSIFDGSDWIEVDLAAMAAAQAARDTANAALAATGNVQGQIDDGLAGIDVAGAVQAANDELNSQLSDLGNAVADLDDQAASLLASNEATEATLANTAAYAIAQSIVVANLREYVDSLSYIAGIPLGTVIETETSQREAGDENLANALSLIGAVSSDGTAFNINLATVYTAPGVSFSDQLNDIFATANAISNGVSLETTSLISNESNARVMGDTALATSISLIGAQSNTAVNNALSEISTETTARTSGDAALSSQLTTLGAQFTSNVATLNAAILNEANARSTADVAEATARTTLAAQFTTANSQTWAAINTEQTVRASADAAFAQTLSLLGGSNAQGTAFVLNQNTTQVGNTGTLASVIGGLNTNFANANAAIGTLSSTTANSIAAISLSLSTLNATVIADNSTLTGSINTESSTRASAISSINTQLTALQSQVTNNSSSSNAALLTESQTRATADGTLANEITALTGTVSTNNSVVFAQLANETTARVAGDVSLTNQITGLTSTVTTNNNNVNAGLTTESSTRASADSALSTSISGLTSTVTTNNNNVNAGLTNEASTRASADTALSTSISGLSSTVTNNYNTLNAGISSEATTRANGDSALSSTISGLTSTVTSNKNSLNASINSEASTRATNDNALTTSINTLSASSTTYLNQDSNFYGYTGGIPAYWGDWSAGGTGVAVAGIGGGGSGYNAAVASGNNQGIAQYLGQITFGWYVVSAKYAINSGTDAGAGVYLDGWATPLSFATDPDSSEYTGASGAGATRTFSKLVNWGYSGWSYIYLMTGWTGFGTVAAKNLSWYNCSIRAASEMEISLGRALVNNGAANLSALVSNLQSATASGDAAQASTSSGIQAQVNGLSSSVSVNSGAISTLETRTAFYGIEVTTSGGNAILQLTSSSAGGTAVQLQGDKIFLGTGIVATSASSLLTVGSIQIDGLNNRILI